MQANGFLACMNFNVSHQMGMLRETLFTFIALEWPFASVRSQMHLQDREESELFVAVTARERPFVRMKSHVIFIRGRLCVLFVAQVAHVHLVVGVHLNMRLQRRRLSE